eukprot:SAG11_NODE_7212_length_1177_cov_1.128015_3_plen_141_part_01
MIYKKLRGVIFYKDLQLYTGTGCTYAVGTAVQYGRTQAVSCIVLRSLEVTHTLVVPQAVDVVRILVWIGSHELDRIGLAARVGAIGIGAGLIDAEEGAAFAPIASLQVVRHRVTRPRLLWWGPNARITGCGLRWAVSFAIF